MISKQNNIFSVITNKKYHKFNYKEVCDLKLDPECMNAAHIQTVLFNLGFKPKKAADGSVTFEKSYPILFWKETPLINFKATVLATDDHSFVVRTSVIDFNGSCYPSYYNRGKKQRNLNVERIDKQINKICNDWLIAGLITV